MLSVKDLSDFLEMKETTFRYQIKKNKQEVEYGYCPEYLNLSACFEFLPVTRKINGRIVVNSQYFVKDLDGFVKVWSEYLRWKLQQKAKKTDKKHFWTESAIDCFNSNGDCDKCPNLSACKGSNTIYPDADGKYPMQRMVDLLLEEIGEPVTFRRCDIAPSIIQL